MPEQLKGTIQEVESPTSGTVKETDGPDEGKYINPGALALVKFEQVSYEKITVNNPNGDKVIRVVIGKLP